MALSHEEHRNVDVHDGDGESDVDREENYGSSNPDDNEDTDLHNAEPVVLTSGFLHLLSMHVCYDLDTMINDRHSPVSWSGSVCCGKMTG